MSNSNYAFTDASMVQLVMTSALHAEGREFDSHWKYFFNICPRGPTDKASDYESGDCGFESHRGCSEVAQRKRVGLITQRSEDRNLPSLIFFHSKKLHRIFFKKLEQSLPGLNRRPLAYQTNALPTELSDLSYLRGKLNFFIENPPVRFVLK